MDSSATAASRPQPLHVIDWGSRALGPRFTELNGKRHWLRKLSIYRSTDVGYILYRPHRDGTFIPFEWKTKRTVPRPPLRR